MNIFFGNDKTPLSNEKFLTKYEEIVHDLMDNHGIDTMFIAMKHKDTQQGLGTIIGSPHDLALAIAGTLSQSEEQDGFRVGSAMHKELGAMMMLDAVAAYYGVAGEIDVHNKIKTLMEERAKKLILNKMT